MTKKQEIQFVREKINECPLETVGQIALLKLADLAVETNSNETTLTIEATLHGKKYKCKMVVTQEAL